MDLFKMAEDFGINAEMLYNGKVVIYRQPLADNEILSLADFLRLLANML